jgi:hypothetical protein
MWSPHTCTLLPLLLSLVFVARLSAGPGKRLPRDPPPGELFSGKALTDLVRDIAAAHAKGHRGPKITLDAALLQQINVAPPGGGNFALLRKGAKLTWPLAFDGEPFKGDREKVDALTAQALQSLKQEPIKGVAKAILADLKGAVQRLGETLRKEVNEIPTSQYLEARRHRGR